MRVVVETLDDAPYDLTENRLRTDAELKLRQAGITVIDPNDLSSVPYLYINVGTIKMPSGLQFVYDSTVQFKQVVFVKIPDVQHYAATWQKGGFGVHSTPEAGTAIRKAVSDHIDEFLNAYLSVNPRSR